MELPKEEYIEVKENGRTINICTMRQKALHTIGLNVGSDAKPYTRHGKKFYKPYRNYFCGKDEDLDQLVKVGYMNCDKVENNCVYWFNRKGLDWLGEQIGVYIYNERD